MTKRRTATPEEREEIKDLARGKNYSNAHFLCRKYGLDHRTVATLIDEVNQEFVRERTRVAIMPWR